MKLYKQITVLAMGVALLSGCEKFLDRPVENRAEATKIDYADLTQMYQPVSGVYSVATRGSFAKWISVTLRSVRGDEIESGNDDAAQIAIHNNQNNVTVKGYWGINDMWISIYGVSLAANSALVELEEFKKNIPASDANNQKLALQYEAEVRFWRALSHYWASRYWGDVPVLGVEANDAANLGNAAKTPRAEVLAKVIEEMDFCATNLQNARPNAATPVGAVTRYTALMLKAKAAMDLAGNDNASPQWDVVLNTTNTIMTEGGFILFPDYYQLWKKPGKMSTESILEFQYTDFGLAAGDIVTSGGPGELWGNFHLFQGPENTYGMPISGSGWMVPTQKALDFLNGRNDSLRRRTTFLLCGVNGAPGTYAVTPDGDTVSGNVARKKWFNGKAYLPKNQMTPGRIDYYGANNNVRVWRYAEVLLMNAEAKVRKGQNGDAPFNLVRQRAKLNPITGVTLQQVLDERRAELICEWWGERFNDLLRTGRAATELPGFVVGQSEFLPIPQDQEDRNSNLKD